MGLSWDPRGHPLGSAWATMNDPKAFVSIFGARIVGARSSLDLQQVQWKIDVFGVWGALWDPRGLPLGFTWFPLDDHGTSFGI